MVFNHAYILNLHVVLIRRSGMARSRGLSFAERKRIVSQDIISDIFGTLFYCIAAILLGMVLVVAFGMKASCQGPSMTGTISNGQQVLIDRFSYKLLNPDRFDVVCFYPKGNESAQLYIKRVIGLPGETVEIKGGFVYIDGVRLIEDYDFNYIDDPGLAETPFKLSDNEYFVLGDNRNNSEDSRIGNVGAVTKEMMVGKVWFKLGGDDYKMGMIK